MVLYGVLLLGPLYLFEGKDTFIDTKILRILDSPFSIVQVGQLPPGTRYLFLGTPGSGNLANIMLVNCYLSDCCQQSDNVGHFTFARYF